MNPLPYDKTSKNSIEEYALKLKGKSFRNVLDSYKNLATNQPLFDEDKAILYEYYNNIRSKGGLGNLIEEYYFHIPPEHHTASEPDFKEAGVELKVTPYIRNDYNSLKAKERLVLGKINYLNQQEDTFEQSHIYKKCAIMLLIYYLHNPTLARIDNIMNYIKLFEFPESDLEIIKKDYELIINKIKSGKAHELSEGDTNYLGACTKGATAESVQIQFNNIPAKQRAFCLKQSYMTYILNKYLANNDTSEPVIKDLKILKEQTLEEYVLRKLSKYYGKTTTELIKELNLTTNENAKSFTYDLAKSMLEILNDKIEEFEKANIKIKAIRLTQNGMPKEAMSFPTFRYTQIINETWEDSSLYETFSTTKYLFMVYQYNEDNSLIFKKAMFWNVPGADLNGEIKDTWEETVRRIKNNEYNNLPKSSETNILHVRPHGQNSKDTYPTPDGKQAVKKCFWFNREYIKKQIFTK